MLELLAGGIVMALVALILIWPAPQGGSGSDEWDEGEGLPTGERRRE